MCAGGCRSGLEGPGSNPLPRRPPSSQESQEDSVGRPAFPGAPHGSPGTPAWVCLITQKLLLDPAARVPPSPAPPQQVITISQRGPGVQPQPGPVLTTSLARAYLVPVLTSSQRLLQNPKVHVEEIAPSPLPDRSGMSRPLPTWGA